MAYDYDLFVIGAGSGGVRASRIAAGHGARVGICEDFRVGGTCVIRGCVPKKLLVYGSKFAHEFEDAAAFGWTLAEPTHSWATLRDNVAKEVDRLNGVYIRLLEGAGVKLHMGRGRLMDRHTIEVGGQTITADKILVATGGAPVVPEIPGREFAISSNEAFHLPELPKRIAIVGGGYIAVEFAGIFNGLGAQVDLVLRRDRVLRGFDEECRTAVHDSLKQSGITMRTEMQIQRIEATPSDSKGGKAPFTVHTQLGGMFETDLVMYATGRAPNTTRHRPGEGGRAGRQGGRHRRRRMVQDHGAQHLGGGRRHRPHQPHAGGADGRPLLRRHRVRQQAAQGRPSRRAVGRVLPARARQCRADGGGGQDAAGRGARLHLGLQADEVHPVRAASSAPS